MALTTLKMGLRSWNLPADLYDHNQLADNWSKIDLHDHTPGRGVQIPTEGIADGAITAAKLAPGANALQQGQVATYNIANGAVTLPTLGSDVTTDYGYAFTTYKHLHTGSVYITAPGTTPTFVFGGALATNGNGSNGAQAVFYFNPADYAAGTRTTYLRLRATLFANAVPLGVNVITSLVAATPTAGTSGNSSTWAAGTSAGSVTINTPPASATTPGVSADFAAPAAGWYGVTVATSAAPAAGAQFAFYYSLQMRQY